jgi:hypothetical protein
VNDGAVCRDQTNASASLRGRRGTAHQQRAGGDGRKNVPRDMVLSQLCFPIFAIEERARMSVIPGEKVFDERSAANSIAFS